MSSGSGSLYLGIDVGTTNVKAIVLDAEGTVVSSGSAPVPVRFPGPDAVEQDIGEICSATAAAITEAAAGAGPQAGRVASIGISSQGGAMQPLDAVGKPVGPVIGWQDNRGRSWDAKNMAAHRPEWFVRRIGCRGSFVGLGTIERLRSEGVLRPDSRIGWVGDRVVGWLCGRAAHDATSLSIAHLCNPSTGREDPQVMAMAGILSRQLPDLLDARQPAGGLLPGLALQLGIPAGIPVGPAVHDQYAAAIGCGAAAPGDVMFGAGTAWVLLSVSERMPRAVSDAWSLIGRHPAGDRFGLMMSLANGGASLAWALQTMGLHEVDDVGVDDRLASVAPGSDGLRFRPLQVPMRRGGSGPTGMAGRLDGIRLGHTSAHVLRSVVEGLACELGRYLAMMRSSGVRPRRLVMCGRASASAVTPGIVAYVTGLPVDCASEPETSAIGAAILGRVLVEPETPIWTLADGMKPSVRRVAPGENRAIGAQLQQEYLHSLQRA